MMQPTSMGPYLSRRSSTTSQPWNLVNRRKVVPPAAKGRRG